MQRRDQGRLALGAPEAAGHATSYELLRIPGRTPPELLDAVVELTAAINDAPQDDLDVEDEVFTAERDRSEIGHQHDTSVVRAHRGHRLGLLLKLEMLRWLGEVEPQLRTLDTWNTETNGPMVAVNERLGYRVLGRALQFQRDL